MGFWENFWIHGLKPALDLPVVWLLLLILAFALFAFFRLVAAYRDECSENDKLRRDYVRLYLSKEDLSERLRSITDSKIELLGHHADLKKTVELLQSAQAKLEEADKARASAHRQLIGIIVSLLADDAMDPEAKVAALKVLLRPDVPA